MQHSSREPTLIPRQYLNKELLASTLYAIFVYKFTIGFVFRFGIHFVFDFLFRAVYFPDESNVHLSEKKKRKRGKENKATTARKQNASRQCMNQSKNVF